MSKNTKLTKKIYGQSKIDKDIVFKQYYSTACPYANLNQTLNNIKSRVNNFYLNINGIIDNISILLDNCNIIKKTIKDETAIMYLDEIKEVFFDFKKIFKSSDLNCNLLLLLELMKLLNENKEFFIENKSSLSSSEEDNEIVNSILLDNLKELRNKVKEQNRNG